MNQVVPTYSVVRQKRPSSALTYQQGTARPYDCTLTQAYLI